MKTIGMFAILCMCVNSLLADSEKLEVFEKKVDSATSIINLYFQRTPIVLKKISQVKKLPEKSALSVEGLEKGYRPTLLEKDKKNKNLLAYSREIDFDRLDKFLNAIEAKKYITTMDMLMIDLQVTALKRTGNKLVKDLMSLIVQAKKYKEDEPNSFKRIVASNKLKESFEAIMKAGGLSYSEKEKKEMLSSF